MTATNETADTSVGEKGAVGKQGAVALGGLVRALAALSCCVLPLVLFSLGVGGVWIGRLSALAPYQPFFIAAAVGFLGYGFWTIYRSPTCDDGDACARPLPSRIVKSALWSATALVALAIAWPYLAPILLS